MTKPPVDVVLERAAVALYLCEHSDHTLKSWSFETKYVRTYWRCLARAALKSVGLNELVGALRNVINHTTPRHLQEAQDLLAIFNKEPSND